jgi:hypothetical protein
MTFDQALQALFGGGMLALGWFCNVVYRATTTLKEDLSKLEVKIAERYLPKEDFNRLADELKEILVRISDKLDEKADK